MGELHLEIYVERMRREYNVECTTGKPRVAYRETITKRAEFYYTHKKQTGGAGQYARVIGHIEPMERDPETGKDLDFENVVMGGNVPSNYIPAVEKVRQLEAFRGACMLMCTLRVSMRPAKRVRCQGTKSVAFASF